MISAIIGKKIGMTQVFRENGEVIPVTAIEAGPCFVSLVKSQGSDGYTAVQLGFGSAKRLNKAAKGHLKGIGDFRYLREFPVEDVAEICRGDKVDVSFLKVGDSVDVCGVSKGKGFAGAVKRHHFAGGPKTHGQSDRHRAPGSIGAGTYPSRVFKGMRMAGHMGAARTTVRRLKVVEADPERSLLLLKGAVPGGSGALLTIKRA